MSDVETLDPAGDPPATPATTTPASLATVSTPATTTVAAPRERAFTQAELDAHAAKARDQGRKAAYSYLQKELGVPILAEGGEITLDQLRALVTQARTGETAASAQLRQLLTDKEAAEARIAEKDSEVRGAYGKAQQMLRLGEAKALAVQLGFNDPRDAVVMLGDLARFEADVDAGTVAGLHDALTALAAEKPYLLKGGAATTTATTTAPPPAIPPTPKPADPRQAAAVEDEEKLAAVRQQAQAFF